MNAAALNIVRAALSAAAAIDPAITQERTQNALLVLDGLLEGNGKLNAATAEAAMFPPIMSPKEVAAVTKLSLRSLRTYAQRGEIRRAYYSGGRKHAAGYVGQSVRDFVERATAASANNQTAEPVPVEVIEN